MLTQLRQRCGGRLLRSSPGREVRMRLKLQGQGGNPERTTIFRLANAAGLKRPEVRPWSGGAQLLFIEESPPPLDHPDLPRKLYAHAAALHDALQGHHERAVSFFSLLATHHLGPEVRCMVDRPRRIPSPARGGGGLGGEGAGVPSSPYPDVPRLELGGGGGIPGAPLGSSSSGVLPLAHGSLAPPPALD